MQSLIFVLSIFFLIQRVSTGQDMLILERKNHKKRILIYEGNQIRFRLKGERHFNQERITSIEEGLIFLETTIIKISEIEVIDIRKYKKPLFDVSSYARVLPFAGITYLLIDQFNHVIIDGRSFNVSGGVLKTSGILIAAGLLIKITERKYFKPKRKNKIKTLKEGS